MSVVVQQNDPTAEPQPASGTELISTDRRKFNRGTLGHSGGKKGRSGPPRNANGFKFGGYCSRLTLPNLPEKLTAVARAVNNLRRPLEKACEDVHGCVDVTHAAAIREALWQERLARIWAKRLVDDYEDDIESEELARITDHIERHTRLCTAAIRSLELRTKKPEGFWDAKSAEAKPE